MLIFLFNSAIWMDQSRLIVKCTPKYLYAWLVSSLGRANMEIWPFGSCKLKPRLAQLLSLVIIKEQLCEVLECCCEFGFIV